MRIGELSRRSGVAVPSIKYYLREGLLPPGAARARNQAEYDETHVRRLRLIRALLDVGGVSVAAARDVTDALDRDDLAAHDLLGVAHHAVAPRRPHRDSGGWAVARSRAADLAAARGWRVRPDAPALDQLADVLVAIDDLDVIELRDSLPTYAATAEALADVELVNVIARRDRERMVELVILGTVLGEALFAALRLLAHEDASARQLGEGTTPEPVRARVRGTAR
jgi:DNA-binding transcriptional MerR regulator